MKYTHNSYRKIKKSAHHLLKNGEFGFKINNFFQISEEQQMRLLTSLIKQIKYITKKKIKIWSNIYFNQVLTKLSSESRMGKGKGIFLKKATFMKPGNIIFELSNLSHTEMLDIYNSLVKKIPKYITIIKKLGY